MKKYNYNVVLDTEFGKKKRYNANTYKRERSQGLLNLLKHTEPVYGNIIKDGSCQLQGKIVTDRSEEIFLWRNITAKLHQ